MTNFKQKTMKPNSETGSFINMLMSSNNTLPEVGKGATVLLYSDRHAYEVIEVSDDKKRVVIQKYDTKRTDNNGISELQEYEYKKLYEYTEVIVWRNGAWRRECPEVNFTNSFKKKAKEAGYDDVYQFLTKEQKELVFGDTLNVVEGITLVRKSYPKINILWGVKDEYYDFAR